MASRGDRKLTPAEFEALGFTEAKARAAFALGWTAFEVALVDSARAVGRLDPMKRKLLHELNEEQARERIRFEDPS